MRYRLFFTQYSVPSALFFFFGFPLEKWAKLIYKEVRSFSCVCVLCALFVCLVFIIRMFLLLLDDFRIVALTRSCYWMNSISYYYYDNNKQRIFFNTKVYPEKTHHTQYVFFLKLNHILLVFKREKHLHYDDINDRWY